MSKTKPSQSGGKQREKRKKPLLDTTSEEQERPHVTRTVANVDDGPPSTDKKSKDIESEKSSKKRKRDVGFDEEEIAIDCKKSKKGNEKKKKSRTKTKDREQSKLAQTADQTSQHDALEGGVADTTLEELKEVPSQELTGEDIYESRARKAARFIVFVGQLPWTATEDSIAKHFEKIPPISIRIPKRNEDPKQNKGFAFLEFDNYDRMKTCLKLYHRTELDDGVSPPRKIKVELTAGGGGNTEQRKEKIRQKNEKLTEERKRRAVEESKQKFERETKEKFAEAKSEGKRSRWNKEKKAGSKGGLKADHHSQMDTTVRGHSSEAHNGIHPDRLARIM